MNIGKICLLFSCLLTIVFSTNYCNKTLCGSSKHIACGNKGSFSSKCAKNAKIVALSAKLRTQIVKRHNEYRNKIAGGFKKFSPAARMATMVWNSELSKLAAYNVKQCQMKHDACRNTPTFQYSGQNLAMVSWKGLTKSIPSVINEHIQMWFNEYKDTSMAYINKYTNPSSGKEIGHFTAMMQDMNIAVGCAILKQVKANGMIQQLMACNYAYTNIMNKPVYAKGKAASKCKTGANKTYKFLCSTDEKY